MGDDGDRGSGSEGGFRTSSSFVPGALFADRFQIERELAGGGMATVYQAVDARSGEHVALKVLKDGRHVEDEARRRFVREADILMSMDHPGIVRIRGCGHASDGTPWLALELLEGETLLDKVRREGPQSARALVPIVQSACDALDQAHAQGVVHRDLKPENIFLPAAGESRVKILDFGLALMVGSAKLTRTGTILGTPRYMAPEQIHSVRSADARVDVYALGVILYEALAGTSPFTASDHGQLLGAILSGNRRPLREMRSDLPTAVDEVLSRALMPDPADRYVSVAELAYAFSEAAGVPSAKPPARISSPPPPRSVAAWPSRPSSVPQFSASGAAPLPARRWPKAFVVGAVVAALLGVGALVWAAMTFLSR